MRSSLFQDIWSQREGKTDLKTRNRPSDKMAIGLLCPLDVLPALFHPVQGEHISREYEIEILK